MRAPKKRGGFGLAGQQFENSPEDKAKDAREAKKRGMSVNQFEGSPADNAMDQALSKRLSKRRK